MSSLRAALIVGLVIVSTPVPALACALPSPWNPAEVTRAEVVVIGRLTNYRRVPVREWRDAPGRPLSRTGGYSEFDLVVERALVGQSPRRMRVRSHTSPFAKAAPDGSYLIALNRPRPTDEPDGPAFTVVDTPCSSAFLMKSGSAKALAVLRVLEGLPPSPPDPPPPPAPPSAEPVPAPTWPAVAGSWPAAEVPAETRVPVVVWIVIGLMGASLAVAFAALVPGRRPRKQDAPPHNDPANLPEAEDE